MHKFFYHSALFFPSKRRVYTKSGSIINVGVTNRVYKKINAAPESAAMVEVTAKSRINNGLIEH